MSLNFQEIHQKIKEIGAGLQEREKERAQHRARARALFAEHAQNVDGLRARVEMLKAIDPNLRCALPVREPLDTHLPPPPLPSQATLIAADGSQINPDRHASVLFGVINVGAIVYHLNSGLTTRIETESALLFEEALSYNGRILSDGLVALRRDLDERRKLEAMAAEFGQDGAPVITFTDGPIELWGGREDDEAEAFYEALQKYKAVLSRLQQRGVINAGYVDKPGAELVVRLLELATYDPSQDGDLRAYRPLRGVGDRWLFGEKGNPLLGSGERSAVFAIQSTSEKQYQGVLAVHFFYINVGTLNHPYPVRVEIPKWVADDAEKLGWLHAVLVDQCRQMGARPYPYLLHRAHEIALVSNEEKFQVEQMLQMEIRRHGGETDEKSYKQTAKDAPGRTGYRS
ncbi:MAG: DNA double-strand break repair nuclease NurA [Anaerolineales bacterium]